MEYLSFEQGRKYDLILLGRIAIDFNPLDYYKTPVSYTHLTLPTILLV